MIKKTPMAIRITLFLLLSVITCFTSFAQAHSKEILLEGKWRMDGWTYMSFVGRGLDAEERQHLTEGISDLIMEFSTDSLFSTNKPAVFGANNVKYEFQDSRYLIYNEFVDVFVVHNQHVFYIHSNLIFKLVKIEDAPHAHICLAEDELLTSDLSGRNENVISENDFYSLRELDVLPRLKEYEDYPCDALCLKRFFTAKILANIDYAKLEYNDIMFNINFVINKDGNFNAFDIRKCTISGMKRVGK